MYDHKIHYCFTLSEEQLEYLRSKKYKMTHFSQIPSSWLISLGRVPIILIWMQRLEPAMS